MTILQASDKIALIYKEARITFRELLEKARQFSRVCKATPGDRWIIFSENRLEWIYAFYGCWEAKMIPVPVDAASTPEEVAYILQDCRPSAVFCSEANAEKIHAALKLAEVQTQIAIFEQMELPEVDLMADSIAEPAPSEIAVIVYTSGTTGSPKGVMLTFENIWANLHSVSAEVPIYRPDDRVMVLLPLHHVLPLQGTMVMPLTIGATIVFAPSLVAADILGTLAEHKITLFLGVPRLFVLLRDGLMSKIRQNKLARMLFFLCARINSLAFSRLVFGSVQRRFGGALRYLPCGGAALDQDVIKDFRTLGFEVLLGYGLSETAPMVSFTHPGTGGRKGAAGQIIPCNEVRSIEGEIVVRGKNVMRGYFERPEETAAVLREGWFYTGDLGHVDADGYIFITGRRKEIIVLPSGKNINPEEVERKLLQYADFVSEAAVLASGDALQALILPNVQAMQAQGIINLEEAIRSEVIRKYNQGTSSYKRILKCTLISESLPRTRLGKLKRHELASLAADTRRLKAEPAMPEPNLEEYRVIKEFLRGQSGLEIKPDDHFELDLSLDSLGKVSFQVFLSGTFALEVEEQTLLDYPTPRKLAEYMHGLATTVSAGKHFKWGELLREKVSLKLPRSWVTFHWLNLCSSLCLRSLFQLRADAVENVPEGACILAPNHQSYLDGFFIMAFLKKKILRDTFFYAKADHLRHWWQRFMASRHNIIVMDINKDLKLSLQKRADVLKKNKKVIIFPEGTRTLDGTLGDFKHTFAILGQELNVPIVPIAVDGAYKVLPRGKVFPRLFQKVTISFLQPIYPTSSDSYSSLSDKVFQALTSELQKTK